jgi:hypothetical protein
MYGVEPDQSLIMIAVQDDEPQLFIGDPYKYKEDEFFTSRIG